jgi:hypothetical protein
VHLGSCTTSITTRPRTRTLRLEPACRGACLRHSEQTDKHRVDLILLPEKHTNERSDLGLRTNLQLIQLLLPQAALRVQLLLYLLKILAQKLIEQAAPSIQFPVQQAQILLRWL